MVKLPIMALQLIVGGMLIGLSFALAINAITDQIGADFVGAAFSGLTGLTGIGTGLINLKTLSENRNAKF